MKETTPEDLVRSYLLGKLSHAELEAFNKRLETDPELAQELALGRAEMAASELLIASETRDLFREWKAENQPRHGLLGNTSLRWLAGIAAVLLLVFAATRFLRPAPEAEATVPEKQTTPANLPKPELQAEPRQPVAGPAPNQPVITRQPAPDYQPLAARLMPEPVLSSLRRTPSDTTVNAFQAAEQAYKAGDYPKTLEWLAQTDSTRRQAATFLKAHALFHLKRFGESEAQFSQLVEWKSRQYRYPGEWGILMCRLADFPNREKEVRQQLNGILGMPDHPYFEQAKILGKALRE